MDLQEIKKLMRWSDNQRPEIQALLVKAEQAEQGWATASAACNRVAGERDRLTADLTSAKEEIERLREQERATEKERRYWYDLAGKANVALASERKETERLRELLRDAFDPMQHFVACQKRLIEKCMCHECIKERSRAALQSRQGELDIVESSGCVGCDIGSPVTDGMHGKGDNRFPCSKSRQGWIEIGDVCEWVQTHNARYKTGCGNTVSASGLEREERCCCCGRVRRAEKEAPCPK